MSSGVFRGKESSNRIELSRLVQDLLNFGVLGSLRLWGWGVGVWGSGVPPHMCTCTCMHTYTCTHIYTLNMIISIANVSSPLGESQGIPYDVICMRACVCMCVCACMCMCVWDTLSPPPPPSTHPPPPSRGDPQNQSKFNST